MTTRSPHVRLPEAIGVLGGGVMGAGIAHAFLVSGCLVQVVERDEEQRVAASARVLRSAAASVERGSTTESLDALAGRLAVGTDDAAFAGCGLVIEAVPEVAELKIESLVRIRVVAPGAIIASNTSSISIDELGAALDDASRFLGLHFFNPVPASKLVEVVRGAATSQQTLDAAQDWVAGIGKRAVTVRDAPGFASSRLGVALGLEAIRMLEHGVASAQDIDAAMELGYRHPVGPLKLTDIVGLDVRLGIAEYLHEKLGERFAPPQLLRDKVAAGELGRKSGRGFYEWPEAGA
ncbi:3-hydroxyacyl-CoA dehydrogenase family protein [Humibacter sp. RRB41]|uniref:3-hydroxyacyl-CoA dehydrogenase family protein n=1 Tax=Humibacter sp. RRB41 TaxID=2919946 RepID=UPI001FA9AEBB|nr:3-hydroxyacyl-CoA dehydrogenase family protein [Humibacter sp. RRB41]